MERQRHPGPVPGFACAQPGLPLLWGVRYRANEFKINGKPWQGQHRSNWSCASTTKAIRHPLRSGRSMLRFATRPPRSMVCSGSLMNPV